MGGARRSASFGQRSGSLALRVSPKMLSPTLSFSFVFFLFYLSIFVCRLHLYIRRTSDEMRISRHGDRGPRTDLRTEIRVRVRNGIAMAMIRDAVRKRNALAYRTNRSRERERVSRGRWKSDGSYLRTLGVVLSSRAAGHRRFRCCTPVHAADNLSATASLSAAVSLSISFRPVEQTIGARNRCGRKPSRCALIIIEPHSRTAHRGH